MCIRDRSSTLDTVITSGCTNLQAKIVSLSVVPVILTHENSEKQIKTFALLDNGSQGSFIKDELLDEFEVDKIDTAITITTVSGETRRRSRAADGFKVASIFSTDKKVFLPRCYSQTSFPVNSNEVPTPEKIKKWKYLQKINCQIPQDEDHIEVQMLISADCPYALEPIEVIHGRSYGPYAVLSLIHI